MTKQDLLTRMQSVKACPKAINWVYSQSGSAQDIWERCERGDWMLWFAAKCNIDARKVVKAAALCASEALKFVPDEEDRPRKCIETVLAWADGNASIEDVCRVGDDAADAATRAVAYAAVRAAAFAANAAAYADDAAANAAAYAAYAAAKAYSAHAAAYDVTCNASLKRSAEIVRSFITKVPQ